MQHSFPEADKLVKRLLSKNVSSCPGPTERIRMHFKPLPLLLTLLLLLSCSTVPLTRRHQLDLIPSSTMLPMSFNAYKDFLSKHTIIRNTPEADMVKRVGVRIQHAVERYFAENNLTSELKGYAWEFNLVDDKQQNAWCMPGGKVVVYSGILPVTRDENGLAVVMGHEIAHAVAKHGDERMSQGLLAQMGGIALSVALSEKPAETQQMFMTAYGAGAQIGVLLPFSRLHESEADHLGLIFMAMAGYDPQAAVEFWQRMSQSHKGPAPPALLSTHPADTKRIENIRKLIPEAMKHYQR
jgi:predicted Zn-dependent protease